MAEDKDNVLGIQTTIDGSEIQQGANEYVKEITRMEKATEKAIDSMSKSYQSLDEQIKGIASSIVQSRTELEKIFSSTSSQDVSTKDAVSSSSTATLARPNGGSSARERAEAKEKQKELNNTIKEERKALEEAIAARDKAAKSIERYTKELEEAVKWQQENASSDPNDIGGKAVEAVEEKLARAKKQFDEANVAIEGIDKGLDALYESSEAYANSTKKGTEAQKEQESMLVKMLGGSEKYKEIMDSLPAPIKDAADNLNKMTKAAKIFIGTPLGAILGVLILAFKSIQAYLTSTAEGQMKLAKITGFLSGVLQPLKNLAISVGEALFNAFTNPKEAIENLWEALKKNIVNRIEAIGEAGASLGQILKSAFKLDMEGVKDGAKDLANAVAKIGTGVDDVYGKLATAGKQVVEFGKKSIQSGNENAKISAETKALELEMKEWEKKKQQLEAKKQQARGVVSNTSLSTKERMDAEKEYEKILDQEYQIELNFINRRIDLQKRSMALGTPSLEDKSTLADLEAERERINADYQRGLAERQDTNGTLINAEREALIELGQMEAELLLANQQRELSIMKDGHAKKMEELENERKSELQKINEIEENFKKQNRRAGVEVGTDGLTDTQRNATKAAREGVEKKYTHDTKELLESELADIMTYQQKRTKIEEEYAQRRAELKEAGVSEENLKNLDKNREDALEAVDAEFAEKESTYRKWLNEIADMTLTQLEDALRSAETALASLEGKEGVSDNDLATARAKVNTLTDTIQKKTEKQLSPKQRSIQDWKDFTDILSESASEFEAMGSAIGGVVGEILGSVGSVASSTVGLINNIVQLTEMSISGTKQTAETASKSVQMVEKASVILAIISAAIQVIQKIINLGKQLHDGKLEKTIQANQEEIDKLDKSYERLSETMEQSFGQGKVQSLKEMNDNLERQNRLIQEQKEAEEDKKDSGDTSQYDDQMAENLKQIEENKKAMEEAIFGDDIKSAIEGFADAYAEAIAKNMNLNESAEKQAKEAMKKMVQESIKEYIQGSQKMEQIRAKMKALYADGVFSEEDQKLIKAEYMRLNNELDAKFGWAEDILNEEDTSSSESSSKRGIATASQESVDENNGRLMSLQMSMEMLKQESAKQSILQSLISTDTTAMREAMSKQNQYISEIVDIQYESVGYLQGIKKNTDLLHDINDRLAAIESNTRNL